MATPKEVNGPFDGDCLSSSENNLDQIQVSMLFHQRHNSTNRCTVNPLCEHRQPHLRCTICSKVRMKTTLNWTVQQKASPAVSSEIEARDTVSSTACCSSPRPDRAGRRRRASFRYLHRYLAGNRLSVLHQLPHHLKQGLKSTESVTIFARKISNYGRHEQVQVRNFSCFQIT